MSTGFLVGDRARKRKERIKKTKGKNERRDGEGWARKEGQREGGEHVEKGLKPPFRPLVTDLSSIICKV